MPDLPETIDTTYPDDTQDPSIEVHQEHHDELHRFHNEFDSDADPDDGDSWRWNEATGKWEPSPAGTGPQGPAGADGADGQGFDWLDLWSGATAYVAYDVVRFDRHAYIATAGNTGQQPDISPSFWDVFVEGGDDGADGVDGADGATGATGPPGPAAEGLFEGDFAGSVTLAVNTYSVFVGTLTNDATLVFDDFDTPTGSITIELHQGAGAPHTVTWPSEIVWFTSDGNPPTLATAEGDFDVVTLYQIGAAWRAFTPGVSATAPVIEYPALSDELVASRTDTTDTNFYQVAPIGGLPGEPVVFQDGDLVLWAILTSRLTATDVPIVTGMGLEEWTQVHTRERVTSGRAFRLTLYAARLADWGSGASGDISMTNDHDGLVSLVLRVPGTPPTAVTTLTDQDVGADGGSSTLSIALATFLAADNRPFAFTGCNRVGGNTAPRTNWTEPSGCDIGISTPSISIAYQRRLGAQDTDASADFGVATTGLIIASELEQGLPIA